MNNPNPFIPQGSLLEQKNRKRTRFQVAVFAIFAFNILVITPMLIQGCKREAQPDNSNPTPTTDTTSTSTPMPPDTNTAQTALPTPTNPVVAPTPTPTPTPPPITPPAPTGTEYVILKGDTLDSIHKKFSVSVKAIKEANPGIVPTKLQPGHKLQIPAAAAAATTASATVATDGSELYVIKTNDSLSAIAKTHGTTVKAIETLNNLKTTRIRVGDKLKLPAAKMAATPPPPVDTTPVPAPAPSTTAPTAPTPARQ